MRIEYFADDHLSCARSDWIPFRNDNANQTVWNRNYNERVKSFLFCCYLYCLKNKRWIFETKHMISKFGSLLFDRIMLSCYNESEFYANTWITQNVMLSSMKWNETQLCDVRLVLDFIQKLCGNQIQMSQMWILTLNLRRMMNRDEKKQQQ